MNVSEGRDPKKKRVRFDTLSESQLFYHNGWVNMKMSAESSSSPNCVRLHDGAAIGLRAEIEVCLVKQKEPLKWEYVLNASC